MAGRTESIRSLCRRTAVCGLCAGLSVVLMAVGSAVGVLTYVGPMLAGIPVYLVRRAWGTRPALCLWAAAGLLVYLVTATAAGSWIAEHVTGRLFGGKPTVTGGVLSPIPTDS